MGLREIITLHCGQAGVQVRKFRNRFSWISCLCCQVGNQVWELFCAEHGITADVERINIQQIDKAYERLLKSDVKYRFVIDMASLK